MQRGTSKCSGMRHCCRNLIWKVEGEILGESSVKLRGRRPTSMYVPSVAVYPFCINVDRFSDAYTVGDKVGYDRDKKGYNRYSRSPICELSHHYYLQCGSTCRRRVT